jgi:Ni/Co efflux regulator RcnB
LLPSNAALAAIFEHSYPQDQNIMKNKTIVRLRAAVICMAVYCAPLATMAQDANMSKKEKKEQQRQDVQAAMEQKNYAIRTDRASTQRGRTINLTSSYGMKVSKEAVECDLPYYGQSYGGSAAGGGGVTFKSVDFTYEQQAGKKGGWDVTIKPKDQPDVQTIIISMSSDGYANISITFTARSMMRYSGQMVFPKK